LLEERGVTRSLQEITDRFEAIYQGTESSPGLRLSGDSPGARLAVASCRRLPLGIVTGRPRADAERFLAESGIAGLVRVVVCMEDGPLKPDPAVVRAALRALGISHAWMIGDTPDDIRSARAAGVLPLGVVAPGDRTEVMAEALRSAGAARILAHLNQIEEILP
jgi:phosphoglycolate phosphatase-like HAD superfamily hydrolase